MALLLLAPFLKLILLKSDERIMGRLVLLLFILICFMSFFNKQQDHWIDNLAWFSFVYLAVGVYKKNYDKKWKWDYRAVGLAGLALYLFMAFVIFMTCQSEDGISAVLYRTFYRWILDIKSLPNVLCAVSAFYFFKNMNIKHGSSAICLCARHTFSVYVIHQTGTFIRFMWDKIFRCAEWIETPYFVLFYILTIITIYFTCMPVDWGRRKFLEPIFIKTKFYKLMERKLNSFYQWN